MLSGKRKRGQFGLGRRVRARKDEDSDIDIVSSADEDLSEGSEGDDDEGSDIDASEEDDDGSEHSQPSESEPEKPSIDLTSVSFGDLAKAHRSLTKESAKKKKSAEQPTSANTKLPYFIDTARPSSKPATKPKPTSREAAAAAAEKAKRSSKHAPMEVTSKKPVSRRREMNPEDAKPKPRDPRFDPLSGPLDEARFKRAYAFLDDYREDEMKELRVTIKKTKDEWEKERLKRQLKSMEGKRDAERRKEEERKVLDEHKKKEKELVKQGKNPFYLKKAERKKRLLMERFKGMSKGQVEKSIVRRRKKEAGKDKKELALLERVTDARSRQR